MNKRVSKLLFYSKAISQRFLVPDAFFRVQSGRKLKWIERYDVEEILDRVDYYNKQQTSFELSGKEIGLGSIPHTRQTAYYYDMRSLLRHFPKRIRVKYLFGDVRDIEAQPTFVKSRAISEANANNILLKLNHVRHFMPISDSIPYEDKLDVLVWRGDGKEHRKVVLRKFCNHPLCDVGQVNFPHEGDPPGWMKQKMTIAEQLQYKFILSIEGNDVATNLKWIAQSNSLCFMARPKYETWMMEGRLVPGEHYVELRDDYADLPEKIEHYKKHPDEAKCMVHNFRGYYQQFSDSRREELIGLLVLQKYLRLSGQLVEK